MESKMLTIQILKYSDPFPVNLNGILSVFFLSAVSATAATVAVSFPAAFSATAKGSAAGEGCGLGCAAVSAEP